MDIELNFPEPARLPLPIPSIPDPQSLIIEEIDSIPNPEPITLTQKEISALFQYALAYLSKRYYNCFDPHSTALLALAYAINKYDPEKALQRSSTGIPCSFKSFYTRELQYWAARDTALCFHLTKSAYESCKTNEERKELALNPISLFISTPIIVTPGKKRGQKIYRYEEFRLNPNVQKTEDSIQIFIVQYDVTNAIQSLTQLQRRIIINHHFKGYRLDYLAPIFGIPYHTIKYQHKQAINRLRILLEGYEFDLPTPR